MASCDPSFSPSHPITVSHPRLCREQRSKVGTRPRLPRSGSERSDCQMQHRGPHVRWGLHSATRSQELPCERVGSNRVLQTPGKHHCGQVLPGADLSNTPLQPQMTEMCLWVFLSQHMSPVEPREKCQISPPSWAHGSAAAARSCSHSWQPAPVHSSVLLTPLPGQLPVKSHGHENKTVSGKYMAQQAGVPGSWLWPRPALAVVAIWRWARGMNQWMETISPPLVHFKDSHLFFF